MSNISQELLHLGFSHLVQMCVMGKRSSLILLILSFISSFYFLSNFQVSKHFITLISGTERPTKLKLGTHMDSGLMHRICLNQTVGAYLLLYFFNCLSLQCQNINVFVTFFLKTMRPTKLNLDIHIGNGFIYCVYETQSKNISNDQEPLQSDPTSCPQNQKGNNQIHKLTAVHDGTRGEPN